MSDVSTFYISQREMLSVPAEEISDTCISLFLPTVSVIVVTYNHERYIDQCLRGILAQNCEFPIEVIVAEDCSADQTQKIVRYYQKEFCWLIRLVTWHHNVGVSANFLRALGRARGKFIALCDGDDYWIAPGKLSKQVALMEASSSTTLCGARAYVIPESPEIPRTIIGPKDCSGEYHLKDTIRTPLYHLSTCMYRKSTLVLSRHVWGIEYLDLYLSCVSAMRGNLKGITDIVSVYRRDRAGISVSRDAYTHYGSMIIVYDALLECVSKDMKSCILRARDEAYAVQAHQLMEIGRVAGGRRAGFRLFRRLARHDIMSAAVLLLHILFPGVYMALRSVKRSARIASLRGRFRASLL